jgi:branched-chain amino acid transport system ATP-binding protein/neutral amino acid transport system ATP-binding protein
VQRGRRGRNERIEALFARFPMLAEKRRQAARTLSGGQRQVLAMAMALMVQPRLLMLDEPSAGLSPKAAESLLRDIAAIHAEGTAIAMVEQNAREALAIADTGVVLVDGRTVRVGPAGAMADDPEIRRLFLGG